MSKTVVLDTLTKEVITMTDDDYFDLVMDDDGNIYEPGRYIVIDGD